MTSPRPRLGLAGARPVGAALALVSLYDKENNAVRQLAAAVRARGRRVVEIYFKDWRNNAFEEPTPPEIQALLRLLREHAVGLVGISVRASAYQDVALRLGRAVREGAGLPVVYGGWHVTVRPEAMIAGADALILGEADASFPAFVDAFFAQDAEALRRTPGMWLAEGGAVLKTPPAPLWADLDTLPWRDFESPDKFHIQRELLRRGDPMDEDPLFQLSASIGCIQKCSFCHNSVETGAAGPRLRFRSIRSVLDEIAAARKRNPKIARIRFDDEIFGLERQWLREFAELYPKEVGLPFDILTEPMVVSEPYAELLGKAGTEYVHMGIQSTEAVNREKLERRANPDATRAAVERLTRHGMRIRYLMMVDIPGVDEAEMAELFDFFQQVPLPYDLYLFSLTHFPGSKMVEDLLRDGVLQPFEIEGEARKTFAQYRVDLGWPRPPAQTWWLTLYVLQASQLAPRRVLGWLAKNKVGRDDPRALIYAARAAALAKTARVAGTMIRSGELTPTLVRRWWNPQTMITM